MKYDIILTTAFKKELKKIKKRGNDINKLTKIVNLLASDIPLDKKYNDHALNDDIRFKDCRECHIEPDWLLVYRKNKTTLILYLIETGSHSDLF